MKTTRLVLGAALLALLAALPACAGLTQSRKEKMLASAPPGYEVQLITLSAKDQRYGRLSVEQTVIDLLVRREGILDVQRGGGREEVLVLAETFVDPYALARTAPERFNVHVISVERPDARPVPGAADGNRTLPDIK